MSPKNDVQKVCSYEKFGFCMKREEYEDFHPTENCVDVKCSIVNCKRRHPQPCRFFGTQNGCRFGSSCKFDHQRQMYFQSELEKMQSEIGKLKENNEKQKILIAESKNKDDIIKILHERVFDLEMQLENLDNKFEDLYNIFEYGTNMPSKIEEIKVQRAKEKDQNEANDTSNEVQEVIMYERSIEDYDLEVNFYKTNHQHIKELKNKVNEKVIADTIDNFKGFKESFAIKAEKLKLQSKTKNDFKELNEQFEEICSKWISTSKKQFKKIAIGDLTNILNEIDRMYTIVCENRKSEYNIPYELIDKI